ncbi:MAG: bifunctional hydroxymethylpyrimidine kinase/phosphomethylpyrimidine kinase [Chloroflexi bacterium]|nr:bifunctional hydroxymethylpyrimidine kinase/phosphomethylpyrimidine kinase [Chloroflexota bacterium]
MKWLYPVALTIAGSDSGGGAGIQADLKTFSALGVYGASVITAVTAQNTLSVTAIHELPPEIVAAQIDAVVTDIGADAVKTGMLSSSLIIQIVAQKIREHRLPNLVVDPVMVAKSGDRLLKEEAVQALKIMLLPLATVVTPNVPEAQVLTGRPIQSPKDAREAARAILALGPRSVVLKGGHLPGDATDLFYDGHQFHELSAPRVNTTSTHGTGCTFASAIAAGLAKGLPLDQALAQAKEYVTEALRLAFPLGQGHGPVHHFYRWWPRRGSQP